MSITSGFFNSVNGDRTYNADDITKYLGGIISNGVYETIGNRLVVTAGSGMSVNVATGRAFINCHWIESDAVETLSIAAASVQYNRIDAVVIRLDTSNRTITFAVKQGTNFSSTPAYPTLTRTSTIYELCLAYVNVVRNATMISQAHITDTRAQTYRCGFVHGVVEQVDTNDLFLQYQAYCEEKTAEIDAYFAEKTDAFNNWFADLTGQLNVDTSLVKYQNTVTVTTETDEINIGIPEYESDDILLVHIGGVLFVEGSEYTISGTGSNAKITLANTIRPNSAVTFIDIKSVIGGNIISMVGANVSVEDETLTITTE